jgi:hypothetical protein
MVENTFYEVGAKYPMFSPDIISSDSIWFVENDVESWDKLQVHVEDVYLSAAFEEAIRGIINQFFMFLRHKMSVICRLIIKSIVSTTLSMALEAQRQIELSRSRMMFILLQGILYVC